MNLLQSKSNSADLFSDTPIHQLLDMELTDMTPAQLDAFIEHTTRIQHQPAARRATHKKESTAIKKGTKHETTETAFAHLF